MGAPFRLQVGICSGEKLGQVLDSKTQNQRRYQSLLCQRLQNSYQNEAFDQQPRATVYGRICLTLVDLFPSVQCVVASQSLSKVEYTGANLYGTSYDRVESLSNFRL